MVVRVPQRGCKFDFFTVKPPQASPLFIRIFKRYKYSLKQYMSGVGSLLGDKGYICEMDKGGVPKR
ncbi:MAG: hypothetical protein DRN40_00545 [Thermoplasmata archaeon]|nr:MAG: hypothetical protein DRN40_00545 [Thermoplasmata archaeon]